MTNKSHEELELLNADFSGSVCVWSECQTDETAYSTASKTVMFGPRHGRTVI